MNAPLAYVRGSQPFRGLEIAVDPRVFIPRPETELLVEAALALPRGARVLEPCTGSGAVALALRSERPDLTVVGADLSPDALDVARANAARLGFDVAFVLGDGIAGVPGGPWDAIVSNPPYVAEEERGAGTLPEELEHHEPGMAFWAGPGGMDSYRRLVSQIGPEVGFVALEVGDGQAVAVGTLLRAAGFPALDGLRAPSGQQRIVRARR